MENPKEKQLDTVATNTMENLPRRMEEEEFYPAFYKRKKPDHPRTEADYFATLLESVTQEDWSEVIKGTVTSAKYGDVAARNWLAQYLMGSPDARVPTPIVSIIEPVKRLTKKKISR